MKKRLLSALLALVMVLALLPVSVFAEPDPAMDRADEPTVTEPEDTPAEDQTPAEEPPVTVEPPAPQNNVAAPQANEGSPIVPRGAAVSPDAKDVLTSGKTRIQYFAKQETDKLNADGSDGGLAPGWYFSFTKKIDNKTYTYYQAVTTGVVGTSTSTSGGTWYTAPTYTNSTGKKVTLTSFYLLNDANLDTADTTSSSMTLNVDLNGHTLSVRDDANKITSLTVGDKLYDTNPVRNARGILSWSGSRNPALANNRDTAKTLQVKATNVEITSLDLKNYQNHNVTLTDCNVTSTINLQGKTDNSNSQTLTLDRCVLGGTVTVTGNSSRVTITDTTGNQDIELTGTGASLTVKGVSAVNKVTLLSTKSNDKKSAAAPSVTVDGGTVARIENSSDDVTTSRYKITVNAQGTVKNIAVSKDDGTKQGADVTLNQGTVSGWMNLGGPSSVTVTGPKARVGGGILFNNGNKSSLKVTGTDNVIGNITCGNAANMTVDIAAEPSNQFGKVVLTGNTGGGIKGGEYAQPVNPSTALSNTLVFQLAKNTKAYADGTAATGTPSYTYFTADQLNKAMDKQDMYYTDGTPAVGDPDDGGTAAVAPTTDTHDLLTFVGQTADGTPKTVTFQNGTVVWGQLTYYSQAAFNLPTLVNGKEVATWTATDVDASPSKVINTYKAGGRYLTPDPMANIIMNAQNAGADATKITNVTVVNTGNLTRNNVRASLGSNNVFTLTGAVTSTAAFAEVKLRLTTDLVASNGVPITVDVPVLYSNGITTFGNAQLPNGMIIESDFNSLRLSNGTVYTLNGTGLTPVAGLLHMDGSKADSDAGTPGDKGTPSKEIVATANISGWTNLQKQALVDKLVGDSATTASNAYFTWNKSPAILQAINAVEAGVTDSQVKSWVTQAQSTYWRANNNGKYNADTDGPATGYDTVWIVPYLDVKASNWNETGLLNATLTPSYRIEVRSTKAGEADIVGKGKHDPIVVKAGTSLGQLTGSLYTTGTKTDSSTTTTVSKTGAPTLKFNLTDSAFTTNSWLHQDSTYVYPGASGVYTIEHAGSNGLGSIVINNTAPLIKTENPQKVQLSGVVDDTIPTILPTIEYADPTYYDTLQAAVDDTYNMAKVTIEADFTGSTAINMSGAARTIYINVKGNNKITSNASGVTVAADNSGHWYTVQLTKDTVVSTASGSAAVSTVQVNNGSATVSINAAGGATTSLTAKAGSVVTVNTAPASGYRTTGVTVSAHMTKTNTNSVVIATRVSDNVYTFKVPEGADSITVTPKFTYGTTVAAIPFTDVATNHWAYNSVKYVYDNGLMNGVNTAGTQFGGTQTLNRAMVVTILYRAAGSPYVGTASSFSDVANNTWYSQAVAWANQNNIVTGYTNGTFQPNWAITRQELATILYRYNTTYKGRATTGSTTLANFPDQGNVSDWATAGMQWAVGNGIVNGVTNGVSTTLSPAGSATRYEAATMLMRYGQGMGL